SEMVREVALANGLAIGSAFVYDSLTSRLDLVSRHFVHEQLLDYRAREIADFAMLQLCEAEFTAGSIAQVVGGRMAEWSPASGGERMMMDEMLRIVEKLYIPRGEEESLFASMDETRHACEHLSSPQSATFGPATDGICFEVPFGP